MAELKFEIKDYGYATKYVQIKNNDFAFSPYLEIKENKPMPVAAEDPVKKEVGVGYLAVKVDMNNKQTYGIVTYVNKFGFDYIVKIDWEDGFKDHQYWSKLKTSVAVWIN